MSQEEKLVTLSLQCSEGRFELNVNAALSLKEVKRLFKTRFEPLFNVNMNVFICAYKGTLLSNESAPLLSVLDKKVAELHYELNAKEDGADAEKPDIVFILVKRSMCLDLLKADTGATSGA
ncbi:hypothetical protein STCU_11004 [Strigomonas culicis]|uniref:Ubiquitin-like domain-containing protein n=1 Tax=Strigomonas culicis TaxID=28005 RepID=S9TK98_9TRYP|nr:hypothetical protein STCU_11004 [Strigomonas culicis]|eukprot:EPY16778.1 hypothetical protein STCU_11004 [Strigomonas culicis]